MMKINGGQSTRVNPEGHGEEASGEEDGVLNGVKARSREGCCVVALVVQLVDVLVQESTLELKMGQISLNARDVLRPDQVQAAS